MSAEVLHILRSLTQTQMTTIDGLLRENAALRVEVVQLQNQLNGVKECEHCGAEFTPSKSSQRFCSTACSGANYRQRKAQEKGEGS